MAQLIVQHDTMLRDLMSFAADTVKMEAEEAIGLGWKTIGQNYREEVQREGHDPERGPVSLRLFVYTVESMAEPREEEEKKVAAEFLNRMNGEADGSDVWESQDLLLVCQPFRINKCVKKECQKQQIRLQMRISFSENKLGRAIMSFLTRECNGQRLVRPAPKGALLPKIRKYVDQKVEKFKGKGNQKSSSNSSSSYSSYSSSYSSNSSNSSSITSSLYSR